MNFETFYQIKIQTLKTIFDTLRQFCSRMKEHIVIECHLNLCFKDGISSLIWTYAESHYFLKYSFPVSLLLILKRKKILFYPKIVIDFKNKIKIG